MNLSLSRLHPSAGKYTTVPHSNAENCDLHLFHGRMIAVKSGSLPRLKVGVCPRNAPSLGAGVAQESAKDMRQLSDSVNGPSSVTVTVRFVGSGDAFGSGGRLQTCLLIDGPGIRFAIDFGTTSLVGLKRLGIAHNSVDAIILTHLHGDHCGGAPFLLMDAMLGAKRQSPLTIAGPPGTESHLDQLQEALFPGSHVMEPKFSVVYEELPKRGNCTVAGLEVETVEARHTKETNPLAIRVEVEGRSVVYTGDGELTPALQDLVRGADLVIAECYFYDKPVKWHLNYPDISQLDANTVILTHMHENMLQQMDAVPETCAYDGLVVEL